jgi:molybdate transport system substrate-binding protein
MDLTIFSGGAAQAVVHHLQQDFEQTHSCTLAATFGAVGVMRDKVLAGETCDVLILSAALISQLAQQDQVVQGSLRAIGTVATGIAVPEGAPALAVHTSDSLKAALTAATGIYVPDLLRSTAGIHIASMLKSLGIDQIVADRLHEYPNGATAMRELAQKGGDGAIGCTQVTEIMYTPGVTLVGVLPPEFALTTVYTAAVCGHARQPTLAAAFVQALCANESLGFRTQSGFGRV